MLLDARLLNASSHATTLNSIFTHLNCSQFVSIIDTTNAFFTMPVALENIPLLSFMFKNRKYAMTRAPQGWKGSPAYLEALLGKAIEDILQAINFADDIIFASADTPEHYIQLLDQLLGNCNALNIRLNKKKLLVMHSDITIVGFRFHLGKLSIPIVRANAIAQHPIPTDSK